MDTYSEAWRAECEARWLAALPTDQARAEYLVMVGNKRGADAARTLRMTTWEILNPASPCHAKAVARADEGEEQSEHTGPP